MAAPTPPPAPRPSKAPKIAAVLALLLLAGGAAAAATLLNHPTTGSASGPVASGARTSSIAPTSVAPSQPPTTPPTSQPIKAPVPVSPTLTIDDKARSQLGELRKQSLAATSIDGRWVLQLDSKWEGVSDPRQTASDGTHVFRAHDILSRYMSLKQAMAAINVPVFLVAATDYGHNTINNHGVIWTTIADPRDIYSQAQGDAECVALFPGLTGLALDDACTPRRLAPPH